MEPEFFQILYNSALIPLSDVTVSVLNAQLSGITDTNETRRRMLHERAHVLSAPDQ
jgi:hypothetical protein